MIFIRKLIRCSLLIGFCYIFVCVCKSLSLLEIINKDWITWLEIENMLFIYLGILVVFYIFFIYTKSELTEIHILLKKHLLMIKFILICLMIISFYKSYNTLLMILFMIEFLVVYCLLDYEANKQYTYNFNHQNKMSSFTEQTVIGREKLTNSQRDSYDQLVALINDRKSTDSFNIGLIGDWGSGKTSITDTLIYELEKENKYFFLKISALTFNETGNIIEYVKNFFGNLFKRYEIDYYFGDSNVAFLGSLAMLNNSTKSMKEIVESIKGNSFVDLEKERILFNDQVRRLLEASKRKNIILIIDDMDRTYHKENIIKLLSEFSSINGLITIVSLNKELNKKEEGQEYNELDKYIHIIIHHKDRKIFSHQLLTQQILESYDRITKKDNCFLSINGYNQYSLYDLIHSFDSKVVIKPVISEDTNYNMMLEIFYGNLKLNNLGFEEYIENCVLEAILNTKEFKGKKEFKNCSLDDLNLKFMSFLEILLLLYEYIISPNDYIKNNISNLNELYKYITDIKVSIIIDRNYFGNMRELKSIVFFNQQPTVDDLIKNHNYEELAKIVNSKIKSMYFLVLNMTQLMGFIDYLDNVITNYRTSKRLLGEAELLDINFLEHIIDKWKMSNCINDKLKELVSKYTELKPLQIYESSVIKFLDSIFVHKFIFQFKNRFQIKKYGDCRVFIYHGDKRHIIILENKNSNGTEKIFIDITGRIIEYKNLISKEKEEIRKKEEIVWSVMNVKLPIEKQLG